MNILANGQAVLTMRILIPWTGAWVADLSVDGDTAPSSGRMAVSGDATLVGTVDPLRSGKFGERPHVGVVGGAGGWAKTVRAQHYHSDGTLPLATPLAATAAEVGETVQVVTPATLAEDFVRVAGLASQVLSGRPWWVGLDGITRVGARPQLPTPESLEVLDWDASRGVASAACDTIIEPGTVIVDGRFNGRRKIVRDVELEMLESGITATLWLTDAAPSAPSTPFGQAIRALAVDAIRPETMRQYRYRVVAMSGDRVTLQAIDRDAPDLQPVRIWAGVPGMSADLAPGAEVLVGFRAGAAPTPIVVAFAPVDGTGWAPLMLTLDAVAKLALGEKAAQVILAGGTTPVARVGDTVQAGPFSGAIVGPGNPKVLA